MSPLTTKWKLSQFVAIPVWYGVGVEMPSPVVVKVVVIVVAIAVVARLELDDDEVVVVVVTSVVDGIEEEVLGVGGAWFNVDVEE